MKKVTAALASMVLVVSLVSLAFAWGSDYQKVTIKSMDAAAGTMVCTDDDGKEMTMKVDKSVDLSKAKEGDKVKIVVEKDMVMKMKPARSKQAVGC